MQLLASLHKFHDSLFTHASIVATARSVRVRKRPMLALLLLIGAGCSDGAESERDSRAPWYAELRGDAGPCPKSVSHESWGCPCDVEDLQVCTGIGSGLTCSQGGWSPFADGVCHPYANSLLSEQCGPQRAKPDGTTPCEHEAKRWVWNGAGCVEEQGCWCTGPGCGTVFVTENACEGAYSSCSRP